jgi:hypothetical protein
MKKMMVGTVLLALTWAVQAQAAEVTWQKDIKPVFDKQCASCHGADSPEHEVFAGDKKGFTGKGVGMRMDTYNHLITHVGWPYNGALMRRLDDGSGKADKKAGNMYEHLGANENERQANLALFKDWVGNWNLKRGKDVSKEELNSLKVKY